MPTKGVAVKFDGTKRDAFLQLLREGTRRGAAAQAVGIHRSTVNDYVNKHPAFGEDISAAEMEANDLVVDALYQAALAGNVVAIQVWLYNRCPDEWADRRQQKTEHSGHVHISFDKQDANL